eukprot:2263463-Amphidinium_carterae.2
MAWRMLDRHNQYVISYVMDDVATHILMILRSDFTSAVSYGRDQAQWVLPAIESKTVYLQPINHV